MKSKTKPASRDPIASQTLTQTNESVNKFRTSFEADDAERLDSRPEASVLIESKQLQRASEIFAHVIKWQCIVQSLSRRLQWTWSILSTPDARHRLNRDLSHEHALIKRLQLTSHDPDTPFHVVANLNATKRPNRAQLRKEVDVNNRMRCKLSRWSIRDWSIHTVAYSQMIRQTICLSPCFRSSAVSASVLVGSYLLTSRHPFTSSRVNVSDIQLFGAGIER